MFTNFINKAKKAVVEAANTVREFFRTFGTFVEDELFEDYSFLTMDEMMSMLYAI